MKLTKIAHSSDSRRFESLFYFKISRFPALLNNNVQRQLPVAVPYKVKKAVCFGDKGVSCHHKDFNGMTGE